MSPRVLVVEDNKTVQMIVQETLAPNCKVTVVDSIANATKAVRESDYDLIMLDVVLPDGSGFDFCKELRSENRTESVPILFLTGQTELDDRVKGLSLGGDDYIHKPFEPRELM